MDVSLALAFAAGLISFASPCVLALVPVYIAFLGESAGAAPVVAVTGGPGGSSARASVQGAAPSGAVIGQALLFVLGFTAVFVLVGTPIGLLGGALFQVERVRQAAGVAVIALGLLTTGTFGPVLDRFTLPSPRPDALPPGRVARALALGALVAVGWTPCIGPVLGTILTMGASSNSGPVALLLLTAYSAGLAVPFLAAAIALPRLRPAISLLRRGHRIVAVVAGLFIMVVGVLIVANAFWRIQGAFSFFL
jgi:cytochrome c-type biogenesis protein